MGESLMIGSQLVKYSRKCVFFQTALFLLFFLLPACQPQEQEARTQRTPTETPSSPKSSEDFGHINLSTSCPQASILLADKHVGNLRFSIPIPELKHPIIQVTSQREPDDILVIHALNFESVPLEYSVWKVSKRLKTRPACPLRFESYDSGFALSTQDMNIYATGLVSQDKLDPLFQACVNQSQDIKLSKVSLLGQELLLDLKLGLNRPLTSEALVTQGRFFDLITSEDTHRLHVSFHFTAHPEGTEIKVQSFGMDCGQVATL